MDKFESRKTAQMLSVEKKYGRDIRALLAEMWERTGSQVEMSRELGVTQSTISLWASRLGVVLTVKPIAILE